MNYLNKILIPLSLFVSLNTNASDLIVVANTELENINVQKRQVRDIFMGNNSDLALKPVALRPNNRVRASFNTKIVGLTESRIQSYWAQMRFSGRKKAPQEFDSVDDVLSFVQSHKNTVAYVPAGTQLPAGVTVIYQTE